MYVAANAAKAYVYGPAPATTPVTRESRRAILYAAERHLDGPETIQCLAATATSTISLPAAAARRQAL